MSVAQSGTYVNRTRPLYASADQTAENWYKFPAANGQIILQDACGSQILQAIGTDLFYDGQLLAKADDIETIDQWSQYPVINPAGVNFDGNPLYGATTITATGSITTLGDISGGGALAIGGSIVGGGTLTVAGDISGGGVLAVTGPLSGSQITVTGAIQGGSLLVSTLPKPIAPGEIQGDSLSVSGAAAVGSVASTGAISGTTITGTGAVQGASLTTTGGLDMTNSAINRAGSINLSNAGFAPYGQLTSPNGVQLLWNGATVSTGAAGDTSQWANFQAVAPILGNGQPISNLASVATTGTITAGNDITTTTNVNAFAFNGTNVEATNIAAGPIGSGKFCIMTNNSITSSTTDGLTISVPSNNLVTTVTSGNMTNTATGIINNVANNYEITADGGLNPLITPNIDLTSKNGNGGQVNIKASPGSVLALGGVVNVVAEGGTVTIPQPPPELPISVTVGGELNLTATTGSGAGLYTATSAINLNAAGINMYAGAIPPFGSLAGYAFIYGNSAVNICSGLPSSGFSLPFATYIYGTGVPLSYGGVRIQSPNGIQMLSDTYMTRLYPLDTDGLTIGGRSFLGTANVFLEDVETLTAVAGSGQVKTDLLNSVGGAGIAYLDDLYPATGKGLFANFVKPNMATATGVPNLVIQGNQNILGGYQNYVQIQNADTIAFDPAASGALSGVKTINGITYPPPAGLVEDWSTYKAVSALDISGFDIGNVVTINGAPYPPAGPDDWYNIPAGANVDISGFDLNNVNNLTMPDNGVIVSAGQLSIFADSGKNLNIATNGGGDLNLGTGNASDINITTGGTGNDLVLAGDTVRMTGTVAVEVNGTLDLVTNNIINVGSITADLVQGETNLTVRADGVGDLTLSTAAGVVNVISPGIGIIINSGATGNTTIDANNIILTPDNEIQMLGPVAVGTVTAPQFVTIEGGVRASEDVVSAVGSSNYSLNTIGGLVAGISSAFRDQTEFYVSNDGSDNNVGNILNPLRTVQAAITAAELVSSATQICIIHVSSGNYVENLVFQKGYVVLSGAIQSQTLNEVTELTGSISIALTGADDLQNRQVVIQGFNISTAQFQSVTDTSTAAHTVTFQDCKMQINSQFFVSTTTATDMRFYLTNCEIQQNNVASSLPVILTNVGLIEFERLDMSISGNASAISITGTSVLNRFSLSALTISSTAATLAPLLLISSTTTATHSLGNVAFAYTSAIAKTATSAIYIASGINTAIIALNNVFTLTGTASSTNYVVGYNGVGTPTIAGINNTSLSVNVVLPQTTTVQPGITQIQYTNIDPPVLGTYSSSIDQTMAVGSTPQALTFNTSQNYHGTLLVAGTRIYVGSQGNYAVNYACQLQNTGGGSIFTQTFLKKNGALVANSSANATITTTTAYLHQSPQIIVPMNGGDYIEVWMNGPVTLSINSQPTSGTVPASPSVLLNIAQIR